jgi:hypothetical protein
MFMKVLRIDDSIIKPMNNVTYQGYLDDIDSYSHVEFRPKIDPGNAWAIPIATGHKYKVHWQFGLDFDKMQVTLSNQWLPTDKDVYLVHNFTDKRAKIDFIMPTRDIVPNQTILSNNTALL